MKYFLIAGEASGDLHASDLMAGIRKVDYHPVFRYYGGDYMREQGGALIKHYKELDFMGFAEVVANLRQILRNMKECQNKIRSFQPDAVILIDYPGFNLRIARFAKKMGIPVYYYISPKIWAWKESRIKKIKKYVDKMFVILPFEVAYYKKFNYPVVYEGHPHIDIIRRRKRSEEELHEFRRKYDLSEKPVIALLPGSRKQELEKVLPVMMAVTDYFPDYQFVLAATPHLPRELYISLTNGYQRVKIIPGKTYEILQLSQAALVTSGTATLETALFNVPQVVCYKTSNLSYQVAKKLVGLRFISLVNLIMNREVVKELLQDDLNVEQLTDELNKIIHHDNYREEMLRDYREFYDKLGEGGAPARIAQNIHSDLLNRNKIS